MSIRVVIADDQREIREGMSMLLSPETDIDCIGVVEDGAQAIAITARERPDVVVMDIRMPGIDGIEATRRITQDQEDEEPDHLTAVLVLTTFEHDDLLHGALRAGASGYMLKHAAPTDLAGAIRKIAAGESWIDPSVAGQVIQTLRATAPVDATGRPTLEALSKREVEVLRHMGDGPTNAELSDLLFVSESTVKTHISRLLMKTGSHDRSQLVALAYRSGLVRP